MESNLLYGYPIEATTENWLHDCLFVALHSVHEDVQLGIFDKTWIDYIPTEYQAKLRTRTGLNRIEEYRNVLRQLTAEEQNQVLKALQNQNLITQLLACECNCDAITDLPKIIRQTILNLFEYAFETLLKELGIRDRHYSQIYNHSHRLCPFCGCEGFDAPGAPREALDHYLADSKYPFASANLKNLVPMGNKCNSRYKLAQDILKKSDGTRRRSFYPYAENAISISLDNSQPFAVRDELPSWKIEFIPPCEEVDTWNEIFHITERYRRDILDVEFKTWLKGFKAWCRPKGISNSNAALLEALKQYLESLKESGFQDRAFLKLAVFHMLEKHCREGNERLSTLLRELVTGVTV